MLQTVKTEIAELIGLFKSSDSLPETFGIPTKGRDKLKVGHEKQLYKQPELLPEMMDFHHYLAESKCFKASDGKTFGTVFEVGILPTNGRTMEYAIEKRDQVASAIRYVPQHKQHPYVLQTFANDEPIDNFIEEMIEYQSRFGENHSYRTEYQKMWGDHLQALSKEGGYFQNKMTGARWGGVQRRVRFCLYRDLSSFDSDMFESPEEEIEQITRQVINGLEESGSSVKLYDPSDVYDWLVPWFNPRPEGEDNGVALIRKYPLRYTKGEDFIGLDELLFKSYPYFDLENRCITYNDKVHSTVVSVDRYNRNPSIGAWTSTVTDNGIRSPTALQRLPEGCVICSTTVFVPNFETENKLDQVSDHSMGNDERTQETKKQIGKSRLALDEDNVLFPSSSYVYVNAESYSALKKNRSKIMSVLRSMHFDPIEMNADLHPLDTYIKYLPISYKPKYDKHLYRQRLTWDKHIANLLPIYGSSQGTGNHGVVFLNPDGMPLSFDPLNPDDKEQNSFTSILAPPGAGKSALLNQLIAATKSTHNPYFVIIDVNGSFKLHHEYFKEHGFEAHYYDVSPSSDMSLPLFENAIECYQAEQRAGACDDTEFDIIGEADDEERDPMGEMILTAKIMITKGMKEAEKEFKPNDYNMLNNAILHAAQVVLARGDTLVKPLDVVSALWHISDTGFMFGHEREYRDERRDRAADMAESMTDYTTGVKGAMFNRDGSVSWPDCDLLVLDLKMLAKEGYEDILYLTYIGLMNSINNLIPKRKGKGRQTVVINDEAHIINMVRTLALFKRKSIKMWRKDGCWLWDATQNIKDYPDEAIDILGVMEWLILLKMPKAELEALKKFREISAEEESIISKLTTEKGKFVEGVVLSNKVRAAFRSVPPAWYLVLGQTEEQEYTARQKLMSEHDVSEIGAAHIMEKQVEANRCAL